jgi:glycosyltransferase involved in cell wall biosynthesis
MRAADLDPAAGRPLDTSSRLRVLAVVDHYLPGFKGGGPVRSVANLVARLGHRIEFDIVTGDRDIGDREPYPEVEVGKWRGLQNYHVRHLRPHERTLSGWLRLLKGRPCDVVYLNSVFSSTTIQLLFLRRVGLIRVPIVVAPRGELQAGALSIHRRRKLAWLALAHGLGLYRDLDWHAATPAEGDDISSSLCSAARVHVARHVPPPSLGWPFGSPFGSRLEPAREKRRGSLRVVFISRISPKKNLDYGLRVLPCVDADVEFDIYGPMEDRRYWHRCRKLIRPGMNVRYRGPLSPDSVVPTFARYHAFLFPTRGESFGQVVFESLAAGCPVLVSDRTPWRDLSGRSAGWDLPLERPAAFAECLQAVADMDESRFAAWSDGARQVASAWASDGTGIDAHARMFLSVAAGRPLSPSEESPGDESPADGWQKQGSRYRM